MDSGGSSSAAYDQYASAMADLTQNKSALGEALTPQMESLLSSSPYAASDAADYSMYYAGQGYNPASELMGQGAQVQSQYMPQAINMAMNYQLSPQAAAALAQGRDAQIAGLQTTANNMVGSSVADLARRGMLSSSTAEGTFGSIAQALSPQIANIYSDYYNKSLTLPGQTASTVANMADQYSQGLQGAGQNIYNLNAQYGGTLGNAIWSKYANPFNLYMQPINTAYGSGGSVSQPQTTDYTGQEIGAAGAIAAAAIMASDRRAKENIELVGYLPNGLPVYTFEYRKGFKHFGEGVHVGVMAQDCLELVPEAVAWLDNGYMAVNYGKLMEA